VFVYLRMASQMAQNISALFLESISCYLLLGFLTVHTWKTGWRVFIYFMKIIFSGYQRLFFLRLKWPGHDAVQSPVGSVCTSGAHMPSQSTRSHSGWHFVICTAGHSLDQMQHSMCSLLWHNCLSLRRYKKLAQSIKTKLAPWIICHHCYCISPKPLTSAITQWL
jgi:hypothetical protein